MSKSYCPHCEGKLPLVEDAFCPYCQLPLDQPPLDRAANHSNPKPSGKRLPSRDIGISALLCGTCAMFVASLSLLRGNWIEAAYTGGSGVALCIGGLVAARWSQDVGDKARRSKWPYVVAAVSVLGVGLFIGMTQFWGSQARTDGAAVAGTAKPGDYQNHFFGFRVQYGSDWYDVTTDAQKRFAEKSRGGIQKTAVLLGLAQQQTSIMFTAESLPESNRGISGSEYLQHVLRQLEQHADPPRDVVEEPPCKLAGLVFVRRSLTRNYAGREIKMTYWVAMTRDYALGITAFYTSSDDLRDVEKLLAQMTQTTEE